MPRLEVEPGVEIHVEDHRPTKGAGRPVLFVAGFGLHSDAWQGQVHPLTTAGYRALALDVRGTGQSSKPLDAYGMDRLAADVVAVLEGLDLRNATLVGWSFGAQIAMRAAVTAPERLAQLVFVGSNAVRASASAEFPFGGDAADLEARLVRLERTKRIETRRRTIASAFRVEPDPDVLGWLLRMQLQMPSWAAIACYRTYLHTDQVAEVGALKLPVLQIMGSVDPVSPIAGAAWLQERLPDGRLVELDCGHYPMLEVPEAFDDALLTFLAEVGA
ncbi:alpha/beta fold hydrolase [Sporichthya polymorpha]|uniref:alpha/beta fold hydrolase n=1 Tax=Sporichthya polymorpha TaxID=35751 RepID=UPI00036A9447|nr:alpha/beta hydrolase [Sporichthya polymorpha]